MIERYGDVVGVWRGYCDSGVEVTGKSLECGHYIPEEKPEKMVEEIIDFF